MEKYIRKSDLKTIKTSEISIDLPDLKNIKESKSTAISKWMADWIKTDLKNGKISVGSLLPSKAEFAYMLGVSTGTMQNALRCLEDMGFVESKQCIGTIVKDYKKTGSSIRKLTSRREMTVEGLKKYIKTYKAGEILPSTRLIAMAIGASVNTTRLALDNLAASGILSRKSKNAKEFGWIVKTLDFYVEEGVESETLVLKVKNDLCKYISDELKLGDKIPAHAELSERFKVSIKTMHDALKMLIQDGILHARRGRYGTTVVKMPNSSASNSYESSIFAPASEAVEYFYVKTQNRIRKMIADNYQIGMKLPSVLELSKQLDLSPNTIRKAIHNLADEGLLAFSRGRYGGTFVIDIPEVQSFKWLSVNPQYAKTYQEQSN